MEEDLAITGKIVSGTGEGAYFTQIGCSSAKRNWALNPTRGPSTWKFQKNFFQPLNSWIRKKGLG
jgi:hypothetical protein